MRIEPPASVPTCSGPKQAAPAAPAPEEEPPGVRRGSQGLRVMPCSGQSPGVFQPNSVVVVLPRMTAPAAFSRAAGAEVLGVSLVTNLAAGMTGQPLSHEEVLAAGRQSATRMGSLLAEVVSRL